MIDIKKALGTFDKGLKTFLTECGYTIEDLQAGTVKLESIRDIDFYHDPLPAFQTVVLHKKDKILAAVDVKYVETSALLDSNGNPQTDVVTFTKVPKEELAKIKPSKNSGEYVDGRKLKSIKEGEKK